MQGTREQADVPSHSIDSTEYDSMNDEPCWWEQGKIRVTHFQYWQSHASVTVYWLVKRNMADSKSAEPILSGQVLYGGGKANTNRPTTSYQQLVQAVGANYKQVNLTSNCKVLRGFERLSVSKKQVSCKLVARWLQGYERSKNMIIDVHDDIVRWSYSIAKIPDEVDWKQAYIDEMIECWEENHKSEEEQKHE